VSALPALLRGLADDIERGAVPSAMQGRLRASLVPVLRCASRDAAVRRLAELLGRHRESRWQTALRIERKLREFSKVAYPRVRSGLRPAYDEIEDLCRLVLDCGGLKARRIWDCLADEVQESRDVVGAGDQGDPDHV
jgi:hypothetical protein